MNKSRYRKNSLSTALINIKRNQTLSFASILTVAISFFVLGIFVLTATNVNSGIRDVASKIEIKIYLNDDITVSEKNNIENTIKKEEGVSKIAYETKSQAFLNLQESLGDNSDLLKGYELAMNPLPNAYIITLSDANFAKQITEKVEKLSGVEEVGNQLDEISMINSVIKVVQMLGAGLFIIFAFISVFLITNTIKIAMHSRRKEIEIMKFVGATNWYVRWPFLIESATVGFVGAGISCLLLVCIYINIVTYISENLETIRLIDGFLIFRIMIPSFLVGGILVGIIGGYRGIKKALRV